MALFQNVKNRIQNLLSQAGNRSGKSSRNITRESESDRINRPRP